MPLRADINLFVFYRSDTEGKTRVSSLLNHLIECRAEAGLHLEERIVDQIFLGDSAQRSEEWYSTMIEDGQYATVSCDYWTDGVYGFLEKLLESRVVDFASIRTPRTGAFRRMFRRAAAPVYIGRVTSLVVYFLIQGYQDGRSRSHGSVRSAKVLIEDNWGKMSATSPVIFVARSAVREFLAVHQGSVESVLNRRKS